MNLELSGSETRIAIKTPEVHEGWNLLITPTSNIQPIIISLLIVSFRSHNGFRILEIVYQSIVSWRFIVPNNSIQHQFSLDFNRRLIHGLSLVEFRNNSSNWMISIESGNLADIFFCCLSIL